MDWDSAFAGIAEFVGDREMFRAVCAVAMAALSVAACASSAEDAGDGSPGAVAPVEQAMALAIANAAAIESNDSSNVDTPAGPWCWTMAGERDDALSQIAESQAKAGDFEGVIAAAELIENANVRAETLAKAVTHRPQAMASDEIQDMMSAAESAANQMDEESCRDSTLSELANAQEAARRIEAALQTMAAIEDRVLRSTVEYQVAKAQVEKGNLAIADDIESPFAIMMVLSETALKQAEAGETMAARRTIADAQEAGDDWLPMVLAAGYPTGMADVYRRIFPFITLMKAQARMGDAAGVRQTAADLADAHATTRNGIPGRTMNGTEVESVELIAEAYAWAGDATKAVATANELEDADSRAQLLKKLSNILDN